MNKDLNIQLSLILPIYNVEPYLEKCIRSLQDQDISKDTYEIICINDGSPDDSQAIVEKLQHDFSNIRLINQENKGVSVARNVGIKAAKGKYLLFVDPDDSLQSNCLETIIRFVEFNKYQVAIMATGIVETDGSKEENLFLEGLESEVTGIDLYYIIRTRSNFNTDHNRVIDPDRSWGIIFDRKFILNNKLLYIPKVPFLEDGEFIARAFCLAEKAGIINEPYYLRLNRPGSATRSDLNKQKKSINGFILAAKNLKQFKENRNLNQVQKDFLNGPIIKFTLLAVQATANMISYKNYFWVKRQLKENDLLVLDTAGKQNVYKKMAKMYNKSIDLFFLSIIKKNLLRKMKLNIK